MSTESPRRPAASLATPTIPTTSEYVVRLVGQVVRVSIETVKVVNSLPAEYAPPTAG
jgi:hypothetical protein